MPTTVRWTTVPSAPHLDAATRGTGQPGRARDGSKSREASNGALRTGYWPLAAEWWRRSDPRPLTARSRWGLASAGLALPKTDVAFKHLRRTQHRVHHVSGPCEGSESVADSLELGPGRGYRERLIKEVVDTPRLVN